MSRRGLAFVIFLALVGVSIFVSIFVKQFHGPELVRNGSFESGQFAGTVSEPATQGVKLLCAGSSSLSDWQVFKQGATSQNCTTNDAVSWVGTPNNFALTAADGQRLLDLTGFASKPPTQFGKVQQDVQGTQAGEFYDLSFDIGSSVKFPPPTPAPPKPPEIGILVEALSVPNGTMSFDAPPTQDNSHWEPRTMYFQATGSTTSIAFSGIGNPSKDTNLGGDYVGLDNVSLRRACSLIQLVLDCQ